MAKQRKSTTFEKFQFTDPQDVIRESANVVRWKPAFAIEWMLEILPKCQNPIMLDYWNFKAEQINNTINSIERTAFYNEDTYWEGVPSQRLEIQKVEYELADWLAMQAFFEAK